MDLKEIPADMTCTQVAQKWYVPSNANMTLAKAVKSTDLLFMEAEEGKKRKRRMLSGERDFCATPPFSYRVKEEEIEDLANDLRKSGKATLFCSALETNNCIPSLFLIHQNYQQTKG